MSISIQSTGASTGTSTSNQYETIINQLEAQLETYEAKLQTENDEKKQAELKEKIQSLQTQIKNYQAKETNRSTPDEDTASSEESDIYSTTSTKSNATVEISSEGKALAEAMQAMEKKQDPLKEEKSENEGNNTDEKNKQAAETLGSNISVLI
ncbi:hypothetical protein [Anaerocolumna xylanovorans]|uniref:FlxA-like protein n=1 Tax=Anaerocolumna xylanovorans DSM 12503 TaxID=1121345 RepID=A0A1M7Y5C6_9FIRM|nr:hypothetical protein [Anaerocolumna xylanovorans]SHO47682.1 hypothetical protein SAMN02745217_01622 [Anaerocolumna xylanovorans DSM 12503]